MNQGLGDKYVVPQWLPFRVASQTRELTTFPVPGPVIDYGPARIAFQESLDDFKQAPSVFVGTELMGVADVIGLKTSAKWLAEYVLTEPIAGKVAHGQARRILGEVAVSQLSERAAIQSRKARLQDFPHDAIAWIEQARLYTILGQRKKAERAIKVGVHLAPSNRFVIRAAVRFYIHYDEWDEALRVAARAHAINPDPLIFGPLLSVATYLKKMPKSTKAAGEAALAADKPFVFSETLEAIGTLEVLNGAEQRAKKFFRHAWVDPTKSVIAHSQWILREQIPGLAADRRFDFTQSNEALGWLRFAFLDFKGAYASSTAWALEEPYSKSPYVLGTIAGCQAERFDLAIEAGERGLGANPKDSLLLNNLAFAYLRNGDAVSARKHFNSIKHLADAPEEIAPAATYGLLLMAEGAQIKGLEYYSTAIDRAVKCGNRRLALRTTLNLIISRLDTAKTIDPSVLRKAMETLPQYQDPGCLGAARAINRRLQAATFTSSVELGTVAREFRDSVEKESSRYLAAVQGRFIDVVARDHSPKTHDILPLESPNREPELFSK
ncbi:hypothetical protein K0B96_03350 [Horticoccus luteus]|uniref:Tetratricopeptide repeat protein n=1 Tax=Horticoccus luteus TaxID=2862869 RepID=A0A8F9TXH6_9BACT|nr:hypothetical protein [Horticoccus luteus]QYM79669.1 hypothetical protein K0B96_03350 [Horticoccus luteus]